MVCNRSSSIISATFTGRTWAPIPLASRRHSAFSIPIAHGAGSMPTNKTRKFWILRGAAVLLLLFPLVAPSTAGKAKSVVGDHADFARYKTYQWVPVKVLTKTGVVEDDPAVSPAIRTAVNRELAAKGLTEVQEGGDLQVAA